MKHTLSLLLMFIALNVFGQKNQEEQVARIVEEGKQLYKTEMASWYGTDLFLANYKNRENIGGYFSYTENELANVYSILKPLIRT